MLTFNLAKLNDGNIVTVRDTDECFTGTSLAGKGFEINIKPLNRSEKIDVASQSVDENGNVLHGKYSKNLFVKSIDSMSGIVDENNNPLDAGFIFDYAPDILVNEVKAVIESFQNEDEEKKSDFDPTQIGQ